LTLKALFKNTYSVLSNIDNTEHLRLENNI